MAEKPYHFEAKVSYTTEENAEVVCSTLAVDPEVSETISPAPAACALPPPHVRACVRVLNRYPSYSLCAATSRMCRTFSDPRWEASDRPLPGGGSTYVEGSVRYLHGLAQTRLRHGGDVWQRFQVRRNILSCSISTLCYAPDVPLI